MDTLEYNYIILLPPLQRKKQTYYICICVYNIHTNLIILFFPLLFHLSVYPGEPSVSIQMFLGYTVFHCMEGTIVVTVFN